MANRIVRPEEITAMFLEAMQHNARFAQIANDAYDGSFPPSKGLGLQVEPESRLDLLWGQPGCNSIAFNPTCFIQY